MYKHFLTIWILCYLLPPVFAQDAEPGMPVSDLRKQLPPLDTLKVIALQNSPQVKFQEAVVRKNQAQIDFSKKLWQNNIMGNVNLSTGNQNLLLLDNTSDLQSTSITNGYRAGVNVNIPLYEFSGRKSRIQLHREELSAARYKKEESELLLERQVESEYYGLLASQRILKIRADARESAAINEVMAEQQFKQGVIGIAELSRVKEITAKAQVEYEIAYADYFTRYHQFEALIGVPLKKLSGQE